LSRSAELVPPTVDDGDWNVVLECLRARFAPFNVAVTDQEPGAIDHTEVVVVNLGSEVNQPDTNTGAEASSGCAAGGGQLAPRGLVFLMWNRAGADNARRCLIAARMPALTFGLDFAFSCPDVMSPLATCDDDSKTFTNADVPCGASAAAPCQCGGATQNSFAVPTAQLGPACGGP
jgi:hypothetical protein